VECMEAAEIIIQWILKASTNTLLCNSVEICKCISELQKYMDLTDNKQNQDLTKEDIALNRQRSTSPPPQTQLTPQPIDTKKTKKDLQEASSKANKEKTKTKAQSKSTSDTSITAKKNKEKQLGKKL